MLKPWGLCFGASLVIRLLVSGRAYPCPDTNKTGRLVHAITAHTVKAMNNYHLSGWVLVIW